MASTRTSGRTSTTRPKGNGAGKGQGWGGPAKGGGTRPSFTPEVQAMSNDAEAKARAAERAEVLRDHLFHLAQHAERQETQIAATVAYLDRTEGKPLQRQDVTSEGRRVGYVIAAPDEDESPEAWQARQEPTLQ